MNGAVDPAVPSCNKHTREAELWFLPSYSPDLTSIDEAFSQFTTLLRCAAPRTHEALIAATRAAPDAITPEDAAG